MRKSSLRLFTGALLGVSELGGAGMRPEKSHLSLASGTRADRRTRTGPSHVNGLALLRGRPFYLAVVRSRVSVRGLHTCPKVHWRVTSGFFAHWRISE